MRKTFIETVEFTDWVEAYLPDDALAKIQRDLLANPERGAVMPGCGGLRKLRIAESRRKKGKRGGARIIYLHVAEADQIHFVTVYGKDQKDDLTAEDKKLFRRLVQTLKAQASDTRGRERT